MQEIQGGCACKAIRYRVTGQPASSVICHCESCRRASAAPSVAWLTFDRQQIEFLSGKPRTHHSSAQVRRGFCEHCGTPLSYECAERPDTIDLTTVSLDDPNAFPPTAEVWMQDKLWWEAYHVALEQYPRGTAEGSYVEETAALPAAPSAAAAVPRPKPGTRRRRAQPPA